MDPQAFSCHLQKKSKDSQTYNLPSYHYLLHNQMEAQFSQHTRLPLLRPFHKASKRLYKGISLKIFEELEQHLYLLVHYVMLTVRLPLPTSKSKLFTITILYGLAHAISSPNFGRYRSQINLSKPMR